MDVAPYPKLVILTGCCNLALNLIYNMLISGVPKSVTAWDSVPFSGTRAGPATVRVRMVEKWKPPIVRQLGNGVGLEYTHLFGAEMCREQPHTRTPISGDQVVFQAISHPKRSAPSIL